MPEAPIRVVYLAAAGRSGSMILERALARAPGVHPGGELCFVWDRGCGEGLPCGCGAAFPDPTGRPSTPPGGGAAAAGPGARSPGWGPITLVSCNPVRFSIGRIRIEPDEECPAAMPARLRRLVAAVALPLLLRHGYMT